MKNEKTLFYNLNLLYFEYDTFQNKFIRDKSVSKNIFFKEFIRLTFELSKNRIKFIVDENSDIVIAPRDTFLSHLNQRIKNFIFDLRSKRKNIYILSNKHIKYAKNIPVIKTKLIVEELDLSTYNALIFTSPRGVKYLDSINKQWKKIPSYAISTETAKEIKNLGGKLAFIGKEKNSYGFAMEIKNELLGKNAAYIGAKEVLCNLENFIECKYIPIYETLSESLKGEINLPDNSIIIFSSPSTIKYFFKNIQWKNSFKAISIGSTTAKYFPQKIKPIVADNTTLQSCVLKALSL
ncbi:uroporphyrinogen-III synthase [Halarcobacter ebronensis]|uniref:Uroporphyrinogen-III synthase n=1 Tax=Halarcobacter ebronensis TaxID=1462615 RepID=A0A4Q0Y971_9BACT|nr:uroporphyrinogen-III synthase [Halarcobacter ebronensis]RXJ66772.1 uroporphyrinogen-III synthase [Halarcobacter ebronensis]